MRLNLCNPLESRDGTLAKDARMKNLLVENIEGVPTAIKRPGVAMATELVAGGAQGLFNLEGGAYAIVDDILWIAISEVDSGSEGYSAQALPAGVSWNIGTLQPSGTWLSGTDYQIGDVVAEWNEIEELWEVWYVVAPNTNINPTSPTGQFYWSATAPTSARYSGSIGAYTGATTADFTSAGYSAYSGSPILKEGGHGSNYAIFTEVNIVSPTSGEIWASIYDTNGFLQGTNQTIGFVSKLA